MTADSPYRFGFVVASNYLVELFNNASLPPDAGDAMPVNESGGDYVSIPLADGLKSTENADAGSD